MSSKLCYWVSKSQILLACSCVKRTTEQNQIKQLWLPRRLESSGGAPHCPATGCADCAQLQLFGRATQNPSNPTLTPGTFFQRVLVSMGFIPQGDLTAAALTQSCLNCCGNSKSGHLKQITELEMKKKIIRHLTPNYSRISDGKKGT